MHITAQTQMMTAATYLGELMIIPTQRMHGAHVTSLRRAGEKESARTTRSYSGNRRVGPASLNDLETNGFHRDLVAGFRRGTMQTYTDQAEYATCSTTKAARLFTRGLVREAIMSFTGAMGKIKSRQGPSPLRV